MRLRHKLRRLWNLWRLDKLPRGTYVFVNAEGHFLTECHTTGGAWWDSSCAHAIENFTWRGFETTKYEFARTHEAVWLLKVDL